MLISGTPSRPAKLPVAVGDYLTPDPLVVGTVANSTLSAGRLYAVPFYVPVPMSFDRIGFWVQTGVASSHARASVYTLPLTTGRPGPLLVDGGERDTSAQGEQIATISLTLGAGFYCACLHVDSAIAVSVYGTTLTSAFGRDTMSGTQRNAAIRITAYGPAPASFGTPDGFQATAPLVLLRRSA